MHFSMLDFLTSARFFLLIARNMKNTVKVFASYIGKAERFKAQPKRIGQYPLEY